MLYLLAIFGVYRVARDLVFEDGPFLLYAKLQALIEQIDPKQEKWYYQGLACPMCLSFWLALFMALLLAPATFQEFMILWLGIAGGAAFLIKLTG